MFYLTVLAHVASPKTINKRISSRRFEEALSNIVRVKAAVSSKSLSDILQNTKALHLIEVFFSSINQITDNF